MTLTLPANDHSAPATAWQPAENLQADPQRPGFASLVLRLRLSLRRDADQARMALLDQILDVAAESEQRLADQQSRISELEALSVTDELTGLPNRRAFESYMTRELTRARRQNGGGVLGYLDLDGFKAINDAHGHAAGDAALLHVAQHLRQAARATDFIARLHGDEFAIVLPEMALAAAQRRTAALCAKVGLNPLAWGETSIPVSISCGLVSYDGQQPLAGLLRASDRAMYSEKQQRRHTAS